MFTDYPLSHQTIKRGTNKVQCYNEAILTKRGHRLKGEEYSQIISMTVTGVSVIN